MAPGPRVSAGSGAAFAVQKLVNKKLPYSLQWSLLLAGGERPALPRPLPPRLRSGRGAGAGPRCRQKGLLVLSVGDFPRLLSHPRCPRPWGGSGAAHRQLQQLRGRWVLSPRCPCCQRSREHRGLSSRRVPHQLCGNQS